MDSHGSSILCPEKRKQNRNSTADTYCGPCKYQQLNGVAVKNGVANTNNPDDSPGVKVMRSFKRMSSHPQHGSPVFRSSGLCVRRSGADHTGAELRIDLPGLVFGYTWNLQPSKLGYSPKFMGWIFLFKGRLRVQVVLFLFKGPKWWTSDFGDSCPPIPFEAVPYKLKSWPCSKVKLRTVKVCRAPLGALALRGPATRPLCNFLARGWL